LQVTWRRALAFAGVVGGLLYVAGDFLFAVQFSSGQAYHSLPVMAQRSDGVLIAGGVVSPLASAGYILGTLGITLRLKARQPPMACAFFVCWTGMFLVGIAYHAVFTTLGFAAKLPDPAAAASTLSRIRALLSTLYDGELAFGITGTLCLAVILLRGASSYPRWLLLFTPTIWALAAPIARTLPAPMGGVIASGWINGWFTLFFLVICLLERRSGIEKEPR
jgi:hypothetical protein